MARLRRLAAVALLCLGASCSQFDLANLGADDFAGTTEAGIVFDAGHDLALDIYRPAGTRMGQPVIVFLYGGGWRSGARQDYRFMGVELARAGFVTVIPDYRKYPDVTYPAFVHDAASAFAWVRDNIAGHGGDPGRIVVMGHSAGAHSAVMLAADARFLAAHGLTPGAIRGVIGLAGPYHFTPQTPEFRRIFNAPDGVPAMQAGNFVDGDEPPMVLLHGELDTTVNRVNLRRLAKALEDRGICHRTRIYPDTGHISIIGAFTWVYDDRPIVGDVIGFAHALADGTLCAGPAG